MGKQKPPQDLRKGTCALLLEGFGLFCTWGGKGGRFQSPVENAASGLHCSAFPCVFPPGVLSPGTAWHGLAGGIAWLLIAFSSHGPSWSGGD